MTDSNEHENQTWGQARRLGKRDDELKWFYNGVIVSGKERHLPLKKVLPILGIFIGKLRETEGYPFKLLRSNLVYAGHEHINIYLEPKRDDVTLTDLQLESAEIRSKYWKQIYPDSEIE